ncbi:MAG TPA: hypothetical protein VKZ63_00115, partial [Kofleriaceae bacterium]|nr:hypothetical protein [Kofleriaceae bacterium]
DDQLWSVHAAYAQIDYFSDDSIAAYEPYFYQAEAELGYPALPTVHLDDLLETQELARDTLPDGVTVTHDPTAMEDIDGWVKSEGERLLFVYGERDPWTAGAFELGGAEDSFLLVAPGANHGAGLRDLTGEDQAVAFGALERWLGVPVATGGRRAAAGRLPPEPPPRLRPHH